MTYQRKDRVGVLIHHVICEILRELKDPRLGFITVTGVKMSPDLRYSRVFVSVLGDVEAQKLTMEGLKSATGFVRTELGKRIRLRFTPEITFDLDESIERGVRISNLLEKVFSESSCQDEE